MKQAGYPAPLGDPASGILLAVEEPVGPRLLKALELSLEAVGLPNAFVTYASAGLLAEEIQAAEPSALVAVGSGAAREIDGLDHPLACNAFSEADVGVWFAWTKGTAGLHLPSLHPALKNDADKRRFWRAFQALKPLAT